MVSGCKCFIWCIGSSHVIYPERYDLMDAAIVCNNCNSVFDDHFGLIHEGNWPGSTTGKLPYIFDQD